MSQAGISQQIEISTRLLNLSQNLTPRDLILCPGPAYDLVINERFAFALGVCLDNAYKIGRSELAWSIPYYLKIGSGIWTRSALAKAVGDFYFCF